MRQTLSERIQSALEAGGDATMFHCSSQTASWADAGHSIEALDELLGSSSVPSDAPIGLVVRNDLETALALISLLGSGRCAVYFNGLQPPKNLAAELASVRPAALICAGSTVDQSILSAIAELGAAMVLVDAQAQFTALTTYRADGAAYHGVPAGTAIEIQTSGTTGVPKRVALPAEIVTGSLTEGTRGAGGDRAPKLKRSPTFLYSPIAHAGGTFGLLLSVIEVRPVLIFDKFRVEEFRAALKRHQPRFVSLPPPMLRMVLDSDLSVEDLAPLLAVRSGTAPLDPDTQAEFEARFGVPVLVTYGATEFMGALARWTLDDHRAFSVSKRGSVGRPSPDIQMRVVDPETGEPAPEGMPGVLEVQGKRVGSEGWLRTTDLARLDVDGFLFILGRTDDAIIRGGFKVMANDVADVLSKHDAVHEAVVISRADPRLGEVPVAAVELKPGRELQPEDLEAFARKHLVAYQIPARILIVPELPRTVSMKVSRPGVRAIFAAAEAGAEQNHEDVR